MPHQINSDLRTCIENCLKCHSICMETVNHCLQKGEEHANADHIKILLDCAQICQTSADFMLRTSALHPDICAICEEACKRCADNCKKIGNDDDLMMRCAEICRKCAESCGQMAKHRKVA